MKHDMFISLLACPMRVLWRMHVLQFKNLWGYFYPGVSVVTAICVYHLHFANKCTCALRASVRFEWHWLLTKTSLSSVSSVKCSQCSIGSELYSVLRMDVTISLKQWATNQTIFLGPLKNVFKEDTTHHHQRIFQGIVFVIRVISKQISITIVLS